MDISNKRSLVHTMNCRDDQTESSRTESRSVQFQSSLRSVSQKSSTILDAMEENVKIDQPGQKCSSRCEKNISHESDYVAELREDMSVMKTIISEQQQRSMVLEDVVISLCDQMRYVIERLPASSAEEQATIQAVLNSSIAKLSDGGRMKSTAFPVNEPSTMENAKEITREVVDSIESLINSNLTLTDEVSNSNIQINQLGDEVTNGDSNIQNVQDYCDVAQEEVLEIQRLESEEGASNGNGGNVNNSEPLVYHLSEKHGPSGSKTLRINIAPSSEQKRPHVGRLAKSEFSSSFSTLPNATSTPIKKKSKSRYERTNSLQQLSSAVSLDDMEWPDTDKILEELEVIKEKSLSNLALESYENKLTVDKSDKSKTLDDQKDLSNQSPVSDCPAGSGHCDAGTDSKSQFAENLPKQLKNNVSNEWCGELDKCGGAVDFIDISATHVTNYVLETNNIPSDICDGPHGCDTISDVVEAKCNEKCVSNNVTNDLESGSGSFHSASKIPTPADDVPQSNSTSAASSQKAGKTSSKKRRRKKLSESEIISKPGEETKDIVSKNQSSVNELCSNPSKPETTPSKSDVPIITSRRKSKNKHSSSNTSTANAGGNNNIQNEISKIDVSTVGNPSNSTTNEISKKIPSVIDSNCPTPLDEAECNDGSKMPERDNLKPTPKELTTSSTPLEESKERNFLITEEIFNPSLVVENTTDKESSTTELCTSLSPTVEIRSHPSSMKNVTNSSPLAADESYNKSSLTNAITEPTSLGGALTMETSPNEFNSLASSTPEISSKSSATDVDVLETFSTTTDVTTDESASGPSLTEVACAPSEKRVDDAKCSKTSDTCQPSSSESPGLDQHMSGPSHFSPEAKEFEPTREYGKAKLLLSPEVSKDTKNKTRCPKLTSTCMDQDNYRPPSEEKQGSCAECGASTSQRCSNCRQVFYCKRDCQREHWKKGHKNDCKPFKVETNSTLGRYLVATRDFKAGDIIFKDEPLFVGPKQITEPICLGCYKRVDGSYRCSKCTWPMCGPVCESSPDHQPECVVGKVMGSPIEIQDFNDTNHFYEVVSPLRGLALKKKAPKKYEELLALESHFNDRVGTHVYNENQKRVVNMLKNYFMLVDFPTEDIDASDRPIHHMTGIIDVNTVEIPLEETDIIGIYPTYSMLEHSCTPNTKYKVSPLYQLTLRAAVNIRQGEHLSTIYTHMLWGTAARRDCLKSTRYFMCTCRRCADPTELGTNFSALRCPKCPLGFIMSAAPLDQLADWICTSCNSTMTGDEANEITLELGEEVETVLANPRVKDLEDFIEKSSATIVHPNHFHLFAARHSLLQMLGREEPGLDEEAVKKKEKLCQEFLKTCTALDPGMCKLSSYVGVALYEYHLAVMARTRQGPTEQQVDKIALKKDLDTAKALLQQCIKVLQEEPSEKPEGQLRNLAEQNLLELSQWESP